ncbi:MAG: DNA-binding protein [Massilioclostridium sp.]|nr:DNA-binding protein [Clostridium facile]PWN00732.1 MAG: DNA-binding protein [Massilioclostridium sp.]
MTLGSTPTPLRGITMRRIQILCNEDRIPGAIKIGRTWAIPDDEPKPADARIKSGRYIKTSTENEKKATFLYQYLLQ